MPIKNELLSGNCLFVRLIVGFSMSMSRILFDFWIYRLGNLFSGGTRSFFPSKNTAASNSIQYQQLYYLVLRLASDSLYSIPMRSLIAATGDSDLETGAQ